jgi:carboxyl-terminal processing protease
MHSFVPRRTWFGALVVATALAGCGGGGGSSSVAPTGTPATPSGAPPPPAWVPGQYAAASTFAGRCAVPRTGTDPTTGRPYPDVAGSTTWENHWLRSWSNAYYLWYRELPDLDPAAYSSTANYFSLLKTSATTPSGKAKDPFHFTYTTTEWVALTQSGASVGYGAEWSVIARTPPRRLVIAYVEPNSPAANGGLQRGAELLTVDGVDFVNANDQASVDRLNAALFPSTAGPHSFTFRQNGASFSLTMNATTVTSRPVLIAKTLTTPTGPVGYILFNDHIATAESQLVDAVRQLQAANVTDLVLDLRYNGGGYLDLASELAFMIAGPTRTAGRTFESLTFNDKAPPGTNPVTGGALSPTPFRSTANFNLPAGTPLPALNLSRVFVLTGPGTCSASESIINGLRGIDVQVIQIGSTTCGKPYGFYPQDNCGTTYFTIQFKGVNAKGFGDYADGFAPQNTVSATPLAAPVPGCSVADDYSRPLGDPLEGRLQSALAYRSTGVCPTGPTGSAGPDATADGLVYKPAFLNNRMMRPE